MVSLIKIVEETRNECYAARRKVKDTDLFLAFDDTSPFPYAERSMLPDTVYKNGVLAESMSVTQKTDRKRENGLLSGVLSVYSQEIC